MKSTDDKLNYILNYYHLKSSYELLNWVYINIQFKTLDLDNEFTFFKHRFLQNETLFTKQCIINKQNVQSSKKKKKSVRFDTLRQIQKLQAHKNSTY